MKWVTDLQTADLLLRRSIFNTPPMNVIHLNSMLLQEAAILVLHRMGLMVFLLFFYIAGNGLLI